MYARHFSLREAPFSITPDSAYFFPHERAQSALNMLLVALRSGEGFVKIVGEVGCGKTVLCRQLLKILQDECVTAYIPNPDMGPDDLLMALVLELGVDLPERQISSNASPKSKSGPKSTSKASLKSNPKTHVKHSTRHELLGALRHALLAHALAGRRVVVCIDEAQAIPLPTLESLRLLSNLETEKTKLLQLVLLGQPELDDKLSQPELRQLLQRITFSEYLGPMAADRVPAYLAHRLATAAVGEGTDTQVFELPAARALAVHSAGVPRLINVLAHKCLMLAYGEGTHRVTVAHVRLAVADTPGVRAATVWQRWLGAWSRWCRPVSRAVASSKRVVPKGVAR